MIKRIVFSTVGLGLLGTFFFGRTRGQLCFHLAGPGSPIRSSKACRSNFEIDRARKMVKDLVPDIQRNMHVIAKEEVEVDQLEHQIADSRSSSWPRTGPN